MHQLNRPVAPSCLSRYQHGRDTWRSITPAHKTEIWLTIDAMQQQRCAYCECAIKTTAAESTAHIEHFRQRDRYPQGTFLWSNLFGSCNNTDRCGKHKDNVPPYTPADLIKIDDEDPEHFLVFLPDGSVAPKLGLNPAEKRRAQETIRIFNLNGPVRQIRESHVQGYIQMAEEIAEWTAEFDEADWLPLLQAELAAIHHLPFVTAIKHTLLPA